MYEEEISTYTWGAWTIVFSAREEDFEPDFDDPEALAWVQGERDGGNFAAWFCAKVTAECAGFHGVDYLGGCAYETFADFTDCDGYFQDMIHAAMLDAIANAESAVHDGDTARAFLAPMPRQLAGEYSAENV